MLSFEKVVIAPQIVIYKNIFKNSRELINILETDKEGSLFCNWHNWYEQGLRKEAVFDLSNNSKFNSENIESVYMKDLCEIFNFIHKDYFEQWGSHDYLWPDFISDWEKLKAEKTYFEIDYFKYDLNKIGEMENGEMLSDYHVDENLLPNVPHPFRHIVTTNIYLNDNYEGGELCAYDDTSKQSYMYKPSPGDAIIMPSMRPFYHGAKSFYNSDRYFLRTFNNYEVFIEEDFAFEEKMLIEQEYIKNHLQTIKVNSNEIVIK